MTTSERTHYLYIIGILIAILIVLLTVRLAASTDVVPYDSFGSNLTSLALALVAIVYAFLSNASLSQTLGSVNQASSVVNAAAQQLINSTTKLDQKIEGIPTLIAGVEKKVDQTVGMMEEIRQAQAAPVRTPEFAV